MGVDYEADLQKVREVLLALADDPRVLREPALVVVVTTLATRQLPCRCVFGLILLLLGCLVHVYEHARDRLKAEGVDIPFPQRVIRVVQEVSAQ